MGSYPLNARAAGPGQHLWVAAQWIGIVATGALIAGLLAAPTFTLAALWNVAIPLLPASFLINPGIWRNVCPLATLGTLPNGLAGRRALGGRWLGMAGAVGMVLLLILVPARRGVFNADGVALAAVILAVALAAACLGAFFDLQAGFCNAMCPVLPVERLYGQRPLLAVANARCAPCTVCTLRACLDLAPSKSIAQLFGRSRRSHRWLTTPYGIFAAAFPGFVIGYYLTADGPLTVMGNVYLTVTAWAAGSYLVTAAAVVGLGPKGGVDPAGARGYCHRVLLLVRCASRLDSPGRGRRGHRGYPNRGVCPPGSVGVGSRAATGRERAMTGTDPLKRFGAEHQEVLQALTRLERAAAALEAGEAAGAQLAVIREVHEVLTTTVRRHNENEEWALFAVLGEEAPLAFFEEEHRALRSLEDELGAALTSRDAPARVPPVARTIVHLLRGHIQREDELLFPMARVLLGSGGLAAVAARLKR